MEPFLYHVFVCDQKKPEGVPGCSASGAGRVIEALRQEIALRGLMDEVQLTTCGSLGLCELGPNMIVYPEGIWYCGVQPDDVPEIVRSHLQEGIPVERLARTDTSTLRAGIISSREKREAAFRAREKAGAPPDDLMQTLRGFQESRALLSAIELDVFSAVGHGTTTAEACAKLETDPRATEMLLNALVSMGLLEKTDGRFTNTAVTSRFLASGSPDNAREGLMHFAGLWKRWSTLTECVRAGTSVTYREMEDRGDEWTHAFIAAMDRNARERSPLVVRAVGTGGVHRMLDVGGGSGAYSIAFAQASKDLRSDLFDLPAVARIARSHIEEAGLEDRIKVRTGDLRRDNFGEGYDLVFVSAICHMLDPQENRDFLRKCSSALAPGGRVVIQDFVLNPDRTAPRSAALFALNMLVGTRGGSSYSVDDYTGWLEESGLRDIKFIRLPGPTALVTGTRRS